MDESNSRREAINAAYASNPKYTNTELAQMFDCTEQYVSKILRPQRRKITDEIKKLYFEKKKCQKEICEKIGVSLPTIRKILKATGEEYLNELDRRKKETRERSRESNRKYMENVRKNREDALIMNELLRLQHQHALEMSTSSKVTTTQIVEQNITHYAYNKSKTALVFKEPWALPGDMPKRLSIKVFSECEHKTFEKGVDGTTINK